MENKEIQIDSAAQSLYADLGGIEERRLKGVSFDQADRLAQGLQEEQRQYDALRSWLSKLVYQISVCLQQLDVSKGGAEKILFAELEKILRIFRKSHHIGKSVLIRYRGASQNPNAMKKGDYEIIFGNIMLNYEVAQNMSKRQGVEVSELTNRMEKSFEALWHHGITNIFLKIPSQANDLKRLLASLKILVCFYGAQKKNAPLTFVRGGKPVTYKPVNNEFNMPDPNLTLLAVLNGLPSEKLQSIVQKIDLWMQKSAGSNTTLRFASVYDAIFSFKNFQKKIIQPPIEVNNVKWMIMYKEEKQLSKKKAQVARLAMDKSGGSTVQTSQVLRGVYGDDYARIDSQQVAERLQMTSQLLDKIEEHDKGKEIETEVLDNVEKRLGKVSDTVFDNLDMVGEEIRDTSPKKKSFIGRINNKIAGMVGFYKRRSVTKNKMTEMVHQAIDFDKQDFKTLARDFNVTVEEATNLIQLLKQCFDENGNFRRSVFVKIIPDLDRYERRIFDFLWHNVKEALHQKDRPAFLDSLQLLVERLKQPKNSMSVLLEDLAKNSNVVRFADQKAFMLANRLVRSHTQEIVSYQITPEDVLMAEKGLKRQITNYAAWKMDRSQEKFFDKIRTIHHRLLQNLDGEDEDTRLLGIRELLVLEREAYIFFALVGGNTGRSVLMSALKEYGNPDSEIYQLISSQMYLADLLQLLKIIVRGIGRYIESNESDILAYVKTRLNVFSQMATSIHEKDIIQQIQLHIEGTVSNNASPG
jgi:hypothetical protein